MSARDRHAAILLMGGTLFGWACPADESVPADPASIVIAQVGDREVTLAGFDRYLMATLGDRAEVEAAEAVVRSRLLDQFLDSEMFVGAAIEAGIEVTEDQVREFPPGNEGAQERARSVLLEKTYTQQDVILKDMAVGEEEVEEYFQSHMDLFRHSSRVVLRKILLDTAHEARRVRSDLIRRPDDFETIAAEQSLSPDGGRAQAYEEETLPQTFRDMLATVERGEISPVIEDPQGFFIIRLEERGAERSPSLAEVRDQIELKLLKEKSEARYRQALRELRERTPVRVVTENLGFEYIGKGSS